MFNATWNGQKTTLKSICLTVESMHVGRNRTKHVGRKKILPPFYSNKIKLDFENNHSPFFFIKFMDTWQKYFIEILFWFL